jgi:hypothetical protein
MRTGGAESKRLFGESADAFRGALEVLSRQEFPQEWAGAQSGMGCGLLVQAKSISGIKRQELLTQAIAAFRGALEVWSEKADPYYYQMTLGYLQEATLLQATK